MNPETPPMPEAYSKDYSKLKVDSETISDKISKTEEGQLREQVAHEYKVGVEHLTNKILVAGKRLKLYNNQRKNPEAIGDNSLFSVMQTLMAQSYFDKLNVKFGGREIGDNDTADNLTMALKYDYSKTYKYIIDYFWDWNALFYGAAPLHVPGLDRNTLLPIHRLLDPLTFIRDPKAAMVNTIAELPGARFWGNIIQIPVDEIKKNKIYMNYEAIENEGSFKDVDLSTLVEQAKQDRDIAQGRDIVTNNTGLVDVLDWHTIFKGKLVRVNFAGKSFDKMIRFQYLKDSEGEHETEWRLLLRQFSPMPIDWDGVSVPDFTEDKQRARARLLNLTLDNVEDTQRQSYLISEDSNVDGKALTNYAFNKYIKARGPLANAIQPIQKQPVNANIVEYITSTMQEIYEKAAATPPMQQGAASKGGSTLGELEMVTAGSMNRYKLFSSIFGWSEKQYAELYYYILKNEFQDGIDVKVIRLKSAFGTTVRELRRENIIAKVDPDVEVETLSDSIQQKTIARENKIRFYGLASQLPDADYKYMMQNLGDDFNIDKQELDMMIPPNAFEYQAANENVELSKNKKVEILPTDEDDTHLKVHSKATDTPAKNAHMYAHTQQKMLKITNPKLFPHLQEQAAAMQGGAAGEAGIPGQAPGTNATASGMQTSPDAMMKPNQTPMNQMGGV